MATVPITCPLCEATCGLEVTLDGNRVVKVRGDEADVFSAGYLCPKGVSLKALHEDPDRLRRPLVKRHGSFHEATWDEAFAEIDARLPKLMQEHGRNAVALYLGNPVAHNLSAMLYGRVLIKAIGTQSVYTASTVDQMPKMFASGYMFGDAASMPVPDVDRVQYLLILGANPVESNGSILTAPDMRRRLLAIRRRGGKVVVIDPKRTRTAELADEHHAIRPGSDALLMFAMVHVLFAEDRVRLGALSEHVAGVDELRKLAAAFTPEAVSAATGLGASDIRRLALDLAAAERGAVYGRIGTTTQAFGTLSSWLVDVLNVLTGNLDREGGAMFPLAAAGQANSKPGERRPFVHGRWRSRVRGLPEVMGELPVTTLADEILTPGEGQVRALVTVAGNPCLSTPNAARLDQALDRLEFMVSLDVYLNETTRHADVILPGPTPFERPHYDLALYRYAVRNVANFSPAVLPADVPDEWETILRLLGVVLGQGPNADIVALDTMIATELARRSQVDVAVVAGRRGPARLLDLLLRAGPYDVTLADLEAAPHGIDFGPLKPRLPGVLATSSGKIELAPAPIVSDVPRLAAELDRKPNGALVLVGRRHLLSNNSWMHNLSPLVRGKNRCTAQIHPEDASRLGLVDGADVVVRSRVGSVRLPVEVTSAIRPGVVSIPHGWGHGADGTRASVAAAHRGENSNVLADDELIDIPTGTAVLNGIPVDIERLPAES